VNDKITITLGRDDWIEVGKFISKEIRRSIEPIALILLIQKMVDSGIKTNELK
jgi:hypothetical protein